MKRRVLALIDGLRRGGVEVSVAETLDAMRAVGAVGIERDALREGLAAALVKDEDDRLLFEEVFAHTFPFAGGSGREGRRRGRRPGGAGAGEPGRGGPGGSGEAARSAGARETSPRGAPAANAPARPASPQWRHEGRLVRPGGHRDTEGRLVRAAAGGRDAEEGDASERRRTAKARRRRELLEKPWREMDPRDVEEARELAAELAQRLRGRLARRERRARGGRIDFRRTFRASVSSGGVPAALRFRSRRPGRPDLLALCDLSGSVAAASEFMLALLAPARAYFRRTHIFGYVDRLCAVAFEQGRVIPEGPLDLYALSDFGRVLRELQAEADRLFTPSTLLLILGDGRNNRRPPYARLLLEARRRVGSLVWLNPEPRARWNTGDSVLALYAPACDAVLECASLGELVAALRRVL